MGIQDKQRPVLLLEKGKLFLGPKEAELKCLSFLQTSPLQGLSMPVAMFPEKIYDSEAGIQAPSPKSLHSITTGEGALCPESK